MEAENTTPTNESASEEQPVQSQNLQENVPFNEEFFKEEALRLKETFFQIHDPDQLQGLRNHLQKIKTLITKLELPWEKYIPIMYKALVPYHQKIKEKDAQIDTLGLATELMTCITFLSQNGKLISHTAIFFDNQIAELDRKLEEKDKQ